MLHRELFNNLLTTNARFRGWGSLQDRYQRFQGFINVFFLLSRRKDVMNPWRFTISVIRHTRRRFFEDSLFVQTNKSFKVRPKFTFWRTNGQIDCRARMELSKEAMNFGKFSWKVNVAEGKVANKGMKSLSLLSRIQISRPNRQTIDPSRRFFLLLVWKRLMISVRDLKIRPQLTDRNTGITPLFLRSAWVLLSPPTERGETGSTA